MMFHIDGKYVLAKHNRNYHDNLAHPPNSLIKRQLKHELFFYSADAFKVL